MQASKFEKLMCAVDDAERVATDMDRLVELMQSAENPMTFKEIGVALYGDAYILSHGYTRTDERHDNQARHITRHLTALMTKLVDFRYVKKIVEKTTTPVTSKDGKIITYWTTEEIPPTTPIEPQYIKVKDEQGREFEIHNPYYRYISPKYKRVEKIVYQKVTRYKWAERE